MKEIPLTKGYVALVDDQDFERVNQYKWHASEDRRPDVSVRTVYAKRGVKRDDGTWTTLYLHSFIMDAPEGLDVDHRDSNGLNNQRYNIRVATRSQNMGNRRKQASSSQFKGITWYKRDGKWQVQIRINGNQKHLGYFDSETDAALAYDAAARNHFGEFALTNFPQQDLAVAV